MSHVPPNLRLPPLEHLQVLEHSYLISLPSNATALSISSGVPEPMVRAGDVLQEPDGVIRPATGCTADSIARTGTHRRPIEPDGREGPGAEGSDAGDGTEVMEAAYLDDKGKI